VAIVLGLSVIDVSQTAMMNLGWDEIRLTHLVFIGDTLYAESIVVDKRESRSRPYARIITCRTRGLNQDGDEVMSWRRSVMVYRHGLPARRASRQGLLPPCKERPAGGVMDVELNEDQKAVKSAGETSCEMSW
jgi:hypothetical protein